MRTRVIHLINPKTDSLTTRPIYLNRALYSPLAGLLAVAAAIPRDQYEVVLTDENIETIDFDLQTDMVGISAMTSYVNRGYEIADQFRAKGVPVVMGGVHPSFMPQEALKHADAVVIGEVELVIDKLLDDLRQGSMRGTYKSDKLHPMVGMAMPRYDLLKKHRYVNKTFVQTSRGCHQGCTFCAEPLMNGLKFRYRPVDEVINEMENCGSRTISINDADFFGTPERPKEVMRALKGRGIHWQAGVTSKLAQDDRMLELAAESGCTMLSIGFESISRATLQSVHKHVNRPETFAALVEKVHSYGIMVFGLFMFGFDGDDTSVFDNTVDVQRRGRLRRLRLFGADPLPRHADLVRNEAGEPHRFLRLDDVRPGPRGLPAGADGAGPTAHRPGPRLHEFLFDVFDREAVSVARQTQSRAMGDLQSLHAQGVADRKHRVDRPGDGATRNRADAADPADQARMARGRARGRRGSWAAHELRGFPSPFFTGRGRRGGAPAQCWVSVKWVTE